MRYFTPDLLERFRSKDDHIAAVASDEWEERAEAYAEHLRSIRSELPRPLRYLLDNYYLHDATVMFTAPLGQLFGIFVKLDTPPRESLALQYELVAEPVIQPHGGCLPGYESLPGHVCAAWLY